MWQLVSKASFQLANTVLSIQPSAILTMVVALKEWEVYDLPATKKPAASSGLLRECNSA
jgi:hypothetical protein